MSQIIKPNLEFYEILNAFPFLKDRLKEEKFNLDNIHEGITIFDYFRNKSYSIDEINILINKLNNDIKHYLKKDKFPEKKEIKILKN